MRLLATILAMVWVVSASATDCSAQDQDDAVGYTQKVRGTRPFFIGVAASN